MFIENAYAAAAGSPGILGSLGGMLPLVGIFVVFYFFLIRPQNKKQKEHQALLSSIIRGDKVLTNGGLIGIVCKPVNEGDTELTLEVAPDTEVQVARSMISNVYKKDSNKKEEQKTEKSKKDKPKKEENKKEESKKEEASSPEEDK